MGLCEVGGSCIATSHGRPLCGRTCAHRRSTDPRQIVDAVFAEHLLLLVARND